MNNRMLRCCALLCLTFFALVSCSKEAVEAPALPKTETEIKYLGKVVPLNLSATLSEDQARAALVYDYDNKIELGKKPKLLLESDVMVATYVRKKGEEAQTISAAVLPGAVTLEAGRYKIDIKGTVQLRQPQHSLTDGQWEVLCIIGGRSEEALPSHDGEVQPNSFKHIIYPTPEWPATIDAGDTGSVFAWKDGDTAISMMPWMTDWSDLNAMKSAPDNLVVEGGIGSNMDLHFAPKGILLKIRVRSDVAQDVQISRVELNSQSLIWGGHFDLSSASNVGSSRQPIFVKSKKIGVALKLNPQEIDKQGRPVAYTLKSGEEMGESFYVWAMPQDPLATTDKHRIKVTVRAGRSEGNEKNLYLASRYDEIVKMQDFPEFYQFAQARPSNGKDDRSRNRGDFKTQNYFVESVQGMSINRLGQGFTYDLRPILSPSEPILLSEILLRPNVPNSNALNNPKAQTYTSAWGGVEIYNASATAIDLSQYAIARITTPDKNDLLKARHFVAHPISLNGGQTGPWTYSMDKALLQRLDFKPNTGSVLVDGTEMPDYKSEYLLVHGTPPRAEGVNEVLLEPGKTAVFLDASYVRYSKQDPSNINVDDVGGIGVQLREAVAKGYAQFVVAIDNAKTKVKQQSWDDPEGPVLYGGIADSYALYRKNGADGAYSLVEYLGITPRDEFDKDGAYLLSFPGFMYTTKYARDGNSRTRFSVVLDRIKNGNDYPMGESWGAASSLENNNTGDFVNHFMTFGSHEWLGPTAKSRQAEWAGVLNFDAAKARRKWKIQRRP